MSLPNYIVNLDELAKLLLDSMRDRTVEYRGDMGGKGFLYRRDRPELPLVWAPSSDILLTGVKTSYEDIRNMGVNYDDTFSMYINGEVIIDKELVGEYENYIRFRQYIPVHKNSQIEFKVHTNRDLDVDIAFGLEFIDTGEDFKPIKVTIKCVDVTLDSSHKHWLIREYNHFFEPPSIRKILAPEISGYEIFGKEYEEVTLLHGGEDLVIVFEYDPLPKEVVISHITTTGTTLEQTREIVDVHTTKTYFAKDFPYYTLISPEEKTVEVEVWSPSPIVVNFTYRLEPKYIIVECYDDDTGELLETKKITVDFYPKNIRVEAPSISGYKRLGDKTKNIEIEFASPDTTVVKFYYEEEEHAIDHEYDYKVVMRWESNSNIDIDLHMYLNNNRSTKVYFGSMTYEDRDGNMWLDYDYTSHGGSDSYFSQPEIGTVEGFDNETWNIYVNQYTSSGMCEDDIEVYIYGIDKSSGREALLDVVYVDSRRLSRGRERTCYVCDVTLSPSGQGRVRRILDYD